MGFFGKWLEPELAAQKDRLFLWSPVVLALGIGLYFSLHFEPPLVIGLAALAVSLPSTILLHRGQQESPARFMLWLCALSVFLIALGFTASQVRTKLVYTPMLAKEIRITEVTGTIDAIERLEEDTGQRVLLSGLAIEKLSPEETPRHIRLRLRQEVELEPGQKVKFLAGLNPPSPPVMPGAFDFQRHMYFMGIGAVGFIYKIPEILEQPRGSGWDLFWSKTRKDMTEWIMSHMEPREGAFAAALVTGMRKAIAKEDEEAMRDSGLAHIISISGLHLSIVAAILFFSSRFLMALIPGFNIRHPIKKYAAALAMIGSFFYMVLADAPVPTQRAMLMTSLVLLAVIVDRTAISMRLVAIAAFIVLLLSPESLLSASFQMSFGAVAALVAFYEHYSPLMTRWYSEAGILRKIALYFLGVGLTTLVAGGATEPFALYHFQQYALYGLLANLVVMPLAGFIIMPSAVLAIFLAPFKLSWIPFFAMEKGIGWMLDTAHYVSSLPGSVLHVSAWPLWALLCVVVAALIVMLWKGRLKLLALPLVALCGAIILLCKQPDIIISSSFDLIAYKPHKGALYASATNKEKFVLENWERMAGLQPGEVQKWPREGMLEGLSCDESGCRVTLKERKVAFAFSPYAVTEDCAWADLLISREPVEGKNCAAPRIIDRFDVWRDGAHAAWLLPGEIRIENVEELRGERPWTRTPADQ